MPYVPTSALPLLPRDTFTFESPLSYDGGTDGTQILRRVLSDSPRFSGPAVPSCSSWVVTKLRPSTTTWLASATST